eukprot:2665272-Rhodomonas_salina.2
MKSLMDVFGGIVAIGEKFPTSQTAEASEKRAQMFLAWNTSGNGSLSLAEIDQGVHQVLFLSCRPRMPSSAHKAREHWTLG